MWLSDNEIRRMYRIAKDRPKQIEIMAQLCCCSKGRIMRICKDDIDSQADRDLKQSKEFEKAVMRYRYRGWTVPELSKVFLTSKAEIMDIIRRNEDGLDVRNVEREQHKNA
jgi:hypothetical protein|nr:MAG TPA: hypothetical protein [Caudoviricetes sp.]